MISEKIIEKASKILKNHNIQSHELDAQLILSNIMKIKREYLITNNKLTIPEKIMEKYDLAIKRRIKREPVAYITGKKEFWSDNYLVNYGTLIPRPETELLIYKIVNFFKNKKINILDIGTGSGCILLSILKELNFSRGIGIDISQPVGNMIVDIGGGTSEIAVIALNGVVTKETIKIAGHEMDEAIVQWFRAEHKLDVGEPTAEKIKKKVGTAMRMDQAPIQIKGRDLVSGIPKTVEVSSDEIRQALKDCVTQIVDVIKRALEKTPPELAVDVLERGIILTLSLIHI